MIRKATELSIDESRRGLKRHVLHEQDNFSAKIESLGIRGRVLNINSSGALIEVSSNSEKNLQKGDRLENIDIYSNNIPLGNYPAAIICHVGRGSDVQQLGILFCNQEDLGSDSQKLEKRSNGRLAINSNFYPYGHFNNPVVYNDVVQFKISDISAHGAKIVMSARNNQHFRGQRINNIHLHFPTIGNTVVDADIQWMNVEKQTNSIKLGLKFKHRKKDFDSIVAQYLMSFGLGKGTHLLDELKKSNIQTKKTKKIVSYDFPKTEDDFVQLLKLRLDAYQRAGKVGKDKTYHDMTDKYDNHSHIVIAKYGNQIVGSIRFTFSANESQGFELDQSIIIPKKFERRKVLEASRACVHESFENTDLIHGLFEAGSQVSAKVGAKWVITSCDYKLLPLYKKLGFKTQGIKFTLKTLNDIPHVFIALSTTVINQSTGLNPIIWYFSYHNVANHLKNMGFYKTVELVWWKKMVYKVGLKLINKK